MLLTGRIDEARWRAARIALAAVARRRGAPEAEVDDVVHSALEKALRRLGSLEDPARFEAWTKRIAANAAVDALRAARRRPIPLDLERHDRVVSPEPDAPLLSFADCVAPFLARLSEKDRTALRLKDLEGRDYAALSTALGLSTPGAKARVRRARQRLAAAMRTCCGALDARPVVEPCPEGAACCAPPAAEA